MTVKDTPQKVLAGRRVALPQEFMAKFSINEGDIILVRQDEKGIVQIIPAEVKAKPMPA